MPSAAAGLSLTADLAEALQLAVAQLQRPAELALTVGLGVDLVEIAPLAYDIEVGGERFLARVYTPAELAYCDKRLERLATRFAAKEAVAKALGTGIRSVDWRDIEVVSQLTGEPTIVLAPNARAAAAARGVDSVLVSLCHTPSHAIAVALAQGRLEPEVDHDGR